MHIAPHLTNRDLKLVVDLCCLQIKLHATHLNTEAAILLKHATDVAMLPITKTITVFAVFSII